jgi:predicted transcriptional regulator
MNLTEKETKALKALVQDGLNTMGGTEPTDLLEDNMTWFNRKSLSKATGFSKHEASGLMSSLEEKGLICIGNEPDQEYPNFVTEEGINLIQKIKENKMNSIQIDSPTITPETTLTKKDLMRESILVCLGQHPKQTRKDLVQYVKSIGSEKTCLRAINELKEEGRIETYCDGKEVFWKLPEKEAPEVIEIPEPKPSLKEALKVAAGKKPVSKEKEKIKLPVKKMNRMASVAEAVKLLVKFDLNSLIESSNSIFINNGGRDNTKEAKACCTMALNFSTAMRCIVPVENEEGFFELKK